MSTYDELPYDDFCFPRTHPEHLFARASLAGVAPPAWDRCRVLELGCARGANLVAMAASLPGCDFVGVDLSARQIDEGARALAPLGLRNVRLVAASIADVGDAFGAFDYVICHGVYSWVAPDARAAILARCRERLAPDGVAYVSYNTLPGWDGLRTLRDLLRRYAPGDAPAAARVRRAREVLALAERALVTPGSAYAAWMREELAALRACGDAYLFHEYLEDFNEPFYLGDFVRAAGDHGLDYLCDADPRTEWHPDAAALLQLSEGAPSRESFEGALDLFTHRRFRASLLRRADAPTRGRATPWSSLPSMWLSSRAELARDCTEASLASDEPLEFTLDGAPARSDDPWVKSLLATLVERRRRPLAYADLVARAASRARVPPGIAPVVASRKLVTLVELVARGLVEAHGGPARYADDAGLRPTAPALARAQAAAGGVVATLRHEQVEVAADARALLPLLDGTRDRAALIDALPAATGDAPAARAGRCEEALDWLAMNALLCP